MKRCVQVLALLAGLSACNGVSPAFEDADTTQVTVSSVEPRETVEIAPVLADTPLGRALSAQILAGPTLAAARAGERVAAARLADQRAATRPSISLGASAVASTGSEPVLQPNVRLTQLLYDGGAAEFSIEASAARTVAAAALTDSRLIARALDAIRAWDDVYRSRRLVAIARTSLQRTVDIESRVKLRLSSGAGRAAETLRVVARRADAAAMLARAEGGLSSAEARFAELFGAVVATGPIPTAPTTFDGPGRSPRLVEMRADIRAAKAELAARRAESAPGLFLDVTGGLDGDDDPALGAGLRLNYAIDTGGRRQAAIDAARAELDRLEAEMFLTEADLRRGLTDAVNREAALLVERSASQAAEDAAAQALRDAEASFESGRVDILDLLDLGRELDQAASRRVTVEAEYRLAGYDRLGVTGTLLGVFGIAPKDAQP
jgi:adhesin transport system outer membrane protein